MKPDAVVPLRMRTQRLWGTRCNNPRDVVRWLTALQAQEFPMAKWSVAQRTRGATKADVEQALTDGVIVRTHVLRPTWHLALAEDIRWLLQVTAPRVNALNTYYNRQHELDKKVFTKSNTLIAKALEGGSHLTRRELAAVLKRGGIRASGPRLAYIVMRAELDALVCSGAMRGKQHTYALLDERTPRTKALGRDEALAEFARRYFTSRGPATLNDFVRWSSLTAAEGREGLALVGKGLESDVIDGKTYWFGPAPRARASAKPAVDLVQGYDEIIMSYSESRDESFRVGDAPFFNAVLLDGRLVGHWKPTAQRNSVLIETVLNRALNREEQKALEAAINAYTKFVGLTAARTRGK
jgi:hypothetical protein